MTTAAARRRLRSSIAFCAPLILYAFTAHRFVGFWDVGEMDTVPYVLGIAHPPGLPLYTLVGWFFSHAVPFGSVAFRMSLLSALSMAGAAWFVYAIVDEIGGEPFAGGAAALLFTCGNVAWDVATRADVHALETLLFAATLWAWVRWYASPSRGRLFIASALFGLAVAAHPLGIFLLPAVLMLVIGRLHEIEQAPLFAAAAIACVAASVWFLYLPLRSAYVSAHHLDPSAAFGLAGGAFWDYDHPVTMANFMQLAFARDVDVGGAFAGYASDRFGAQAMALLLLLVRGTGGAGILAACAGVVFMSRTQSLVTAALVVSGFAPAFFGATFADESDAARYALPAFLVVAVFAGYAAARLPYVKARKVAPLILVATSAVLLVSQSYRVADAADRSALQQTDAIFARTPNNAVLVADWTLAPALAYRAYVDRAAGNRTVLAYWWGEIGGVIGAWPRGRPVFVVGTPEGSVAGYGLERLSAYPQLYRAERTTAKL